MQTYDISISHIQFTPDKMQAYQNEIAVLLELRKQGDNKPGKSNPLPHIEFYFV